jgi:hypothetical protein
MEIKDLEVDQGCTFEWLILVQDINGNPLDMTNYTGGTAGVRCAIKKRATDPLSVVPISLSILNNTGLIAAKNSGRCHLTTAEFAALEPDLSGKCYVLMVIEATNTANKPTGAFLYDMEIEDNTGYVFKPYRGTFTFKNKEMTT